MVHDSVSHALSEDDKKRRRNVSNRLLNEAGSIIHTLLLHQRLRCSFTDLPADDVCLMRDVHELLSRVCMAFGPEEVIGKKAKRMHVRQQVASHLGLVTVTDDAPAAALDSASLPPGSSPAATPEGLSAAATGHVPAQVAPASTQAHTRQSQDLLMTGMWPVSQLPPAGAGPRPPMPVPAPGGGTSWPPDVVTSPPAAAVTPFAPPSAAHAVNASTPVAATATSATSVATASFGTAATATPAPPGNGMAPLVASPANSSNSTPRQPPPVPLYVSALLSRNFAGGMALYKLCLQHAELLMSGHANGHLGLPPGQRWDAATFVGVQQALKQWATLNGEAHMQQLQAFARQPHSAIELVVMLECAHQQLMTTAATGGGGAATTATAAGATAGAMTPNALVNGGCLPPALPAQPSLSASSLQPAALQPQPPPVQVSSSRPHQSPVNAGAVVATHAPSQVSAMVPAVAISSDTQAVGAGEFKNSQMWAGHMAQQL